VKTQSPLLIDCQYVRPQFAGAYLVVEEERALFVENNTSHSVPILLNALRAQGLSPEQVEYLIITHVHLDHAGGTHALMEACPRAKLLAHPKAAPHMMDPSKLVASATRVYGEVAFQKLYGQMGPIHAARVQVMGDGEELKFGSRTLRFFYTRGHANHHFCIFDSGSQGVFTGDSFGLAYPALQHHGLFIFPSTSPTDFHPEEALASVDRIQNCGANRAFLTHFGEVRDLTSAASQLRYHLEFSAELMNRAIIRSCSNEELDEYCESELRGHFETVLERHGLPLNASTWEWIQMDLQLNAAGIAHAARRSRARKSGGSEVGKGS